jgi:nucleoside-diphosphate-sugar epimerase
MSTAPKGKVLVTGSNGFVGRPLCIELMKRGWLVRGSVRTQEGSKLLEDQTVTGPMDGKTVWCHSLQGIDRVIHLAARVHVMNDTATDPLAAFLTVNFHGTVNLAKQAAEFGVKRFIYLSTIKVNGESSHFPFRESDPPQPRDAYAISKFRAELALREIGRETGLEIVVIRPPLVYGPGVTANFLRLLHWVDKGLPLPLGSVQNRRSLVSIDNLIDLICCCLEHPAAGGQTFLVSDGSDLSTPVLLKNIASAMGKSPRLFSCPPWILRLIGGILGRSAEIDRLCGSLQININKACKQLNWQPPLSASQGVNQTVQWYLQHRADNNV